MAFSSRVFGLLESELRRHVSFFFRIEGELNPRTVRPMQQLRLRAWVRNDSGIHLKSLRGWLRPTLLTEFKQAPFLVEQLPPGAEQEIGALDVRILQRPRNGFLFDQIATVNVAGEADLSEFRFREAGRALTYVQAPISPSPEPAAAGARAARPARIVPVPATPDA